MAREISSDQNYFQKLLRLIPSEIIAAYLVIVGIIPATDMKWGHITVSIVMILIIPFYLWRVLCIKNRFQIIATTIAFVIWIYSMNGGPFLSFGIYKPWIASVILILWTVVMPIIVNPADEIVVNDDKEKKDKNNIEKTVKKTGKKP